MWKLSIEDDEGTKTLLPLVRDEYLVGRDEKNTIRLTERNISRHHATLKKNGDAAWHIVDHDSYNGCYVNGQRVAGDVKLTHSDVIQVGDYRIFITNDSMMDVEAVTSAGTSRSAPAASAATDKPDRLIMLVGPDPGSEHVLNQGPVTIGRAEDCTISINHPSVSRVHAEVKALGGGRYEIFDRGSSNGIRVNGTDFRRTLLEGGDLVELGDVKLRFVERGTVYRPLSDASQQISALSSQAAFNAGTRKGSKRSLMLGVWAGAAGLFLLLLVGFLAFRGSADARSETAEDPARVALVAAKTAFNAGDFAACAAKLGEIPEGSPIRQSSEVLAMYSRWSEWALQKAQDSTDPAEKRRLLTSVAQTQGVAPDQRAKATDLLAKLTTPTDVKPPSPGDSPPAVSVAAPTPTPGLTIDLSDPPRTAAPLPLPPPTSNPDRPVATHREPPPPPAPDKTATGAAGAPSAPDPLAGQAAEMATRRQLEGKMNSHKATKDELRMLKAICQHQGDAACKGRAADAMKNAPLVLFLTGS